MRMQGRQIRRIKCRGQTRALYGWTHLVGSLKLHLSCEVRGLALVTQHLPLTGTFQFLLYDRKQGQNGKPCWRPGKMAATGYGHSCHDVELVPTRIVRLVVIPRCFSNRLIKPIVLSLCMTYWYYAAPNLLPNLLISSFRLPY